MLDTEMHPMQESRLKNIMRNNERLQKLGVRPFGSIFASPTVFSPKKTRNDCSGSDYDPEEEEDIIEGDLDDVSDDNDSHVDPLPS